MNLSPGAKNLMINACRWVFVRCADEIDRRVNDDPNKMLSVETKRKMRAASSAIRVDCQKYEKKK